MRESSDIFCGNDATQSHLGKSLSGPLTLGLDHSGSHGLQCFSSTPGLCPLDNGSTPPYSHTVVIKNINVPRHCQVSLGAGLLPVQNHYSNLSTWQWTSKGTVSKHHQMSFFMESLRFTLNIK